MGPNHKGGKVNRFEPQSIVDITSSPLILSCFQNVGCFEFCEKVKQVKHHPELTRLFVLNLHNKQVNLARVDFELSVDAISNAIGIIVVGEKWFKKARLDMKHYEPFVKTRYRVGCRAIFPFSHLKQRFAPLMRVIMKYFTCEGDTPDFVPTMLDSS